jgi:hypothetical protein
MAARLYDPSLVNLPRNRRYVAVSHDCAEHNAKVDAAVAEREPMRLARTPEARLPKADRRRVRRGRVTQTKETSAPAAKLLKRALGHHVAAPGFHHDPRQRQVRSQAALDRAQMLQEMRLHARGR